MEFYARYYAPNNAILIVAGDVEPEEVFELAREHYGPLEPTVDLPPRARPEEPPQLAERRLSMTDPRVSQPYVTRIYLAPERDSGAQETAAALEFLSALLGGDAATSVLGRKLTYEDPKAVYVSAYYDGDSIDDGTFSLVIVPTPEVSLAEAENALDGALAEFLEEGVDSEQFERLKTRLRASRIYERDDIAAMARRYGQQLAVGLTVEDIEAWPDILDAVTEEDVMEAAHMIFDKRKAVTGWLSSEPAAQPEPAAELEETDG